MKHVKNLNLFESATLRLTVWYVALIMLLSVLFSGVLYSVASVEVERALGPRGQSGQRIFVDDPLIVVERQQRIVDGNTRIALSLVFFNVAVLVAGAGVSYALAKRTLRPIEAAHAAQAQFASDAAHELRTPLAAMQTETEVMLRAKMATKQDYRETLQSTLEEVHRLRALTDRLLALAAQERIELSEISTKALVDRVVERARPLAQETRITLGVSGTDDEFRVFGNTEAIENILGIFVDNALKYSPEHTAVTIRREVSERRTLRFVVLDQGAGISLEQQERVFERFYRADTSRTSQQVAGNGLGLSLAQRLATEMNGTVGVVSEVGNGSEFYLELPLR